jgi:hypothetical protein
METHSELLIPPSTASDPKAQEVLRAWVAHGGLHCSLRIGVWKQDDATVWGILLTDVARHVADAMKEEKGIKKSETIDKIRSAFNNELDSPTDEPTGHFVE